MLSGWRAEVILLRHLRATTLPGEPLQPGVFDVHSCLERLLAAEELTVLDQELDLYMVTSPYAQGGTLAPWEILMELNPWATVAFCSALQFHGLAEPVVTDYHLVLPKSAPTWNPIGTVDEDWMEGRLGGWRSGTKRLGGLPVHWHFLNRTFDFEEYRPLGYPVRVTSRERTLMDSLLEPGWCGGFANVVRGWVEAAPHLKLAQMLDLVDASDMPILRQRAGWFLERLGFRDVRLDGWAARSIRGGSARLLATAPYQNTFSERWCLSLNAPPGTLEQFPGE